MIRHRRALVIFAVAGFAAIAGLYCAGAARHFALGRELRANIINDERDKEKAQFEKAYLKAEAAKRDAAGVRLTEIDRFPEHLRPIVRAVIAALRPTDAAPEHYMAIIEQESDGIHFDLRYDLHPTDYTALGDGCGKCREAIYDPNTTTVRIHGIR